MLPSFTGSADVPLARLGVLDDEDGSDGGGHCDDDEREHREREDHGTGVWLRKAAHVFGSSCNVVFERLASYF